MAPGGGFPTAASMTTRCPKGKTMPNISRDTATLQIADGPVESYSADLDGGYTVNIGRFRPGMSRTRRQPGHGGARVCRSRDRDMRQTPSQNRMF
jgi:hypothetical protein